MRREFDRLKGVPEEQAEPKFSGLEFFAALGHGTALRAALLCLLYDRRRSKPFTPGLTMRNVESILESTPEGLSFALWYLKQRNLVTSDDKSNLMISVEGMDFLESKPPAPETILPLFKPTGLAKPATTVPPGDSSLERIREVLARA
jgi:hypothetical protein